MTSPLPAAGGHPRKRPDGAHHGLWFDRYFDRYDVDWKVNVTGANDPKRSWIETVVGLCGDAGRLNDQRQRSDQLARALGGCSRCYRTDWHFATGLGLPHPVENGMLWHPTLGVPYLPGAAVKGLVRAFAEQWLDPPAGADQRRRWFGGAQHDELAEKAGDYIFFDAQPVKPPRLACDIMTPHMGQWYQQGGGADPLAADTCPGDWHEPVPIPFLVVKEASFQFAIAPRPGTSSSGGDELDRLFDLLEQALAWAGAGAKTAVGYGSMSRDQRQEADLQARWDEQQRQREEGERRAAMSPAERALHEFIDQTRTDNLPIALLQQLESGAWDDNPELQRAAARSIRDAWRADKKWNPDFDGTNAKKVKQRDRCLVVQGFLG